MIGLKKMNNTTNRLELNWIGKYENTINPEPRILVEDKEYSYGENSDNMLIHGDNLLALKSLESEYAGRIKCIYIDPPYNTGSAFEHYDDNLEHSTWLNLMKPRLELLKNLLADNGFIFVQIDDNESHYLKVLLDEIFGRRNYRNSIYWKRTFAGKTVSKNLPSNVDTILFYSKNPDTKIYKIAGDLSDLDKLAYNKNDNDGRGFYTTVSMQKTGNPTKGTVYDYIDNNGNVYKCPSKGWRMIESKIKNLENDNRLYFTKSTIREKYYLSEREKIGKQLDNLWLDIGNMNRSKNEQLGFMGQKPEALIKRILEMSTNKGDLVLDSFLGSGTTAAVAQKMGRKWIGIELGEHAYTHCYPRLKAVVDGEQGGISKAVNWKGGGGFKFYELAPSLLEKDGYGNFDISGKYNEKMLAQALAKHEGYTYAPDENIFWKQGFLGDKNFIFTTPTHISIEFLDNITSELKEDEYLLIFSESFDKACVNRYKNIILRNIPKVLLGRCEWGKDNYNLNTIFDDIGADEWGNEDEQ